MYKVSSSVVPGLLSASSPSWSDPQSNTFAWAFLCLLILNDIPCLCMAIFHKHQITERHAQIIHANLASGYMHASGMQETIMLLMSCQYDWYTYIC